MQVDLPAIQAARQRIHNAIYRTPCRYSLLLSQLYGCAIYCKYDHLQMTGSFKERGARNKLLTLSEEQRSHGVIAASAGNHALGLAYHGRQLKIPVTVVMPVWAPLVKVTNCRNLGAQVILQGETFDDARKLAQEMAHTRRWEYIHGFDDPAIIAGQGTVGLEILEEVPDLDAIIVPVGGGGLIAGVGTAVKALRPSVRVIGAEPHAAPTLHASLQKGAITRVNTKPTLADGLAISEVGHLCFALAQKTVDQVVLVDEAEIARSVLRLLEVEKTVVEGAGAVALAALQDPTLHLSGKKLVLLLSGGNIDVTLIARIIERGLATDGRLCRLTAHMPDRPGSLARLTQVIASTGASVKEIYHDRNFAPSDVALVNIVCVMETRDRAHIAELHHALRQANLQFTVPTPEILLDQT